MQDHQDDKHPDYGHARQCADEERRGTLTLELSAIFDEVTFGQHYAFFHTAFDIRHRTTQIASQDIAADHHAPVDIFMHQLVWPGCTVREIRHVAELDWSPVIGKVQPQCPDVAVIAAVRLLQTDNEIEPSLPFQHLRH